MHVTMTWDCVLMPSEPCSLYCLTVGFGSAVVHDLSCNMYVILILTIYTYLEIMKPVKFDKADVVYICPMVWSMFWRNPQVTYITDSLTQCLPCVIRYPRYR